MGRKKIVRVVRWINKNEARWGLVHGYRWGDSGAGHDDSNRQRYNPQFEAKINSCSSSLVECQVG